MLLYYISLHYTTVYYIKLYCSTVLQYIILQYTMFYHVDLCCRISQHQLNLFQIVFIISRYIKLVRHIPIIIYIVRHIYIYIHIIFLISPLHHAMKYNITLDKYSWMMFGIGQIIPMAFCWDANCNLLGRISKLTVPVPNIIRAPPRLDTYIMLHILIWRFPKNGVPLNHPFQWDFPFVVPPFMETLIYSPLPDDEFPHL